MNDASAHDGRATHVPAMGSAHERTLSIRLMMTGVLVGLFGPIGGFLGGGIVSAEATIVGLEPLFVWLFFGIIVGGVGVAIGILGAVRWVRGNHHLD